MDYDTEQKANLVSCVRWVRRGVAKANPDKVELSAEELEAIIRQTKQEVVANVENEENKEFDESKSCGNDKNHDEFDFAHYDDETNGSSALSIGSIAVNAGTSKKDPYVTVDDGDDEDSEAEDDIVLPGDNLILVSHIDGDASILEVYVYNEEGEALYVHHDILLPSFPLCLEWLGYEPETQGAHGNLCAVGTMSSVIEVWDIDLVDCLESACKLGRKGNKKKGIKQVGHKDAVLDLAWNTILPHILASGSVDQTVLLWDLDNCCPASKFTTFEEKVQALKWHPFEGQTLLTGCCDGVARVFDCRTENSFKEWSLEGEVERVLWNHFNPFNFFVSTSVGKVFNIDCRSDSSLWQLDAHSSEVTGLSMSTHCPGLLVTASTDGDAKIWDIGQQGNSTPILVSCKDIGLGALHCLEGSPDSPFVFCAGGDARSNNFKVWDLRYENSPVEKQFSTRQLLETKTLKADPDAEAAERQFSTRQLLETRTIKADPDAQAVEMQFSTHQLLETKTLKADPDAQVGDRMDTTDHAAAAMESLTLEQEHKYSRHKCFNKKKHKSKGFKKC